MSRPDEQLVQYVAEPAQVAQPEQFIQVSF
jgi:hypothetical protein